VQRRLFAQALRMMASNGMHQVMYTSPTKEMIMWTKPAATEMRFGFEVTMYVMNK